MTIDILKNFIQSSNINFMFGSGLSRPYLPVLGEIESRLTQLSHDATIGKDERKIIETAIYKEYFTGVIYPNLSVPVVEGEDKNRYQEVMEQYSLFFQLWSYILHHRSNNILSRQINIYSTNIDMFVERAADLMKVEFNDGFRGTINPILDETMFQKKVMKNSVHFMNTTEVPTFNLLKIHGGINWLTNEVGDITKDSALSQVVKVSDALKALKNENQIQYGELSTMRCDFDLLENPEDSVKEAEPFLAEYEKIAMVNPNKSKFSLTVTDSHFYEMMRMYSNSLEKENSLLFAMGFSFADEHILNITCRTARSNPTLNIIIFAYQDSVKDGFSSKFEGFPNVFIIGPSDLKDKDGTPLAPEFSFKGINVIFNHIKNLIPPQFLHGTI